MEFAFVAQGDDAALGDLSEVDPATSGIDAGPDGPDFLSGLKGGSVRISV